MATYDSRLGSSNTPPSGGGNGEAQILVRISPVIEREFKRRDVFVELRVERAQSILSGTTGVHQVSISRAREIAADAQSQRWVNGVRGLTVAYGALARNVAEAIKQEERRGLFDDPGIDVARQRMAESPARLDVGDHVLHFDDASEYGHQVVVVGGYDLYSPRAKNGPFIGADGRRFEYRYGYLVKEGSQQYFADAHQLTRADCKPSHLRLVARTARPV